MTVVRATLATLSILAFGACASTTPHFNDDMIIPGERVGDVELGMSLAELFAVKGAPHKTIPIAGTEATSYNYDGLTVGADDKVYWIIARDARFRTPAGVAKGSEQIFTRSVYGTPRCVVTRGDITVYDYNDVYFEVENETGKVNQIGIQKNTQTCNGS
ncbi:hypothetical protein [uncultured Hyphomonas sp.]|uniref:hypothetical protein n=1 Tax=uncultured Hyphomonas sp. TaxID=225298 RepID=UPI002AAC16C9|nr:hypothetical protein [uncultured Hyphomonas sp.]